MIEMRLADVAAVTGGHLHRASGAERVSAVEFDSRAVGPGGLFLALPGERADGHAFAAAAVAAGAAGVLAARPVDAPAVIVPPAPRAAGTALDEHDPDGAGAAVLAALARLARHVVAGVARARRDRGDRQLRQDLHEGPAGRGAGAARAHGRAARVVQQRARPAVDRAARRCRHPAPGAGVLRPRSPGTSPRWPPRSRRRGSGWCSTSGSAHLGRVRLRRPRSPRPRASWSRRCPRAGVAVLNADDPLVAAMAERTVGPGAAGRASARAAGIAPRTSGWTRGRARFTLVTPPGSASVALRLVGAHHVGNALAAAAVGPGARRHPGGGRRRAGSAPPASRWRMEVTERPDGVTVVNDAYNANPESMRAALEALAAIGARPADLGGARRDGASWARRPAARARRGRAGGARAGIAELIAVARPRTTAAEAAAGRRRRRRRSCCWRRAGPR